MSLRATASSPKAAGCRSIPLNFYPFELLFRHKAVSHILCEPYRKLFDGLTHSNLAALITSHVIKKLRSRLDTRHQQMISRPRAGNVEQMAFGVIHLLQVGVVANRFDAFLQGNDFIVAGHYDHGAKLQSQTT